MASPYLRTMKPMPPPVVSPPMPTEWVSPVESARPWALRRAGEVAGGGARLDAGDPRLGVDADALHLREVDDDGVVDHAEVGEAVAAAAHRQRQGVVAGEVDRRRDVVGVRRAHDRQRAAVDGEVEDAARLVVVGVVGGDEPAAQARGERVQSAPGRSNRCARRRSSR